MIHVAPIDRSTIDGWMISESGLPPRVVHSCEAKGPHRVGELRQISEVRQGACPGMGAACIRQIRQYMDTCGRLESGRQSYADFAALLADFLKPAQREVLEHRYSLLRPAPNEAAPPATLQAVGNRRKLTRERVRQVEKTALEILGRALATACMEAVVSFFAQALKNGHGLMGTGQIDALPDPGFFGPYRPAGILALLCDCQSRFTARPDFFAAFPPKTLLRLESQVLDILRAGGQAVPVNRLILGVEPVPGFEDPATHSYIVDFMIRHTPVLSLTDDGFCFTGEAGAAVMMTRILSTLPGPVHFRTLQEAFNLRIQAGRRQGAGYILEVLRNQPGFVCAGNGCYALRSPVPAPPPGEGGAPA